MINRDFTRITALFRLPLSLTSVHSLPEALVLNVVRNIVFGVVRTMLMT